MNYYLKKFSQVGFTFLVVVHITFFLMRALPGGPAEYLRAQLMSQGIANSGMDQERVNQIVEAYVNVNPEQPFLDQYFEYMGSLLQGDFGRSIWYQDPVVDIYAEALPWTIYLMGTSILLMYVIGILLGAAMAYKEGSQFDVSFTVTGIVLNSVPFYLFAILLIYIFSIKLGWFPFKGRYPPDMNPEWSLTFLRGIIEHSILPIASIVITGFGTVALSMRGNSIRVIGEDYNRVARLRGLSDLRISVRYVGRNAVLPLYTGMMISLGALFGGSVILEQMFLYRGMGYYLFTGVNSRDYPLVMGGFMLITLTILLGIFIAELTYGLIDPRASEGGSHEQY